MSGKPENMSYISSVDGKSPRGLLNTGEAMKSLKRGAIAGGLASAAAVVALTVLSDFNSWYTGPFKEVIAGFVGIAVMYMRAQIVSQRLAEEGDDPK
jgi:hypothetical protein